jgi:hypothetical protein
LKRSLRERSEEFINELVARQRHQPAPNRSRIYRPGAAPTA